MKLRLSFAFIAALCFLLLTACGEPTAHEIYDQALEKLRLAESLTAERTDTVFEAKNSHLSIVGTDDKKYGGTTIFYYAKTAEGNLLTTESNMWINEDPDIISKTFYRDGWNYSEITGKPEENLRTEVETDFAYRAVMGGLLEFPKSVIAEQTIENTAEGTKLLFIFDSEKFYAHTYPDTYAEYGYGGFSTYVQPPTYTVLIDTAGNIKQIDHHYCTVTSDSSAFMEDRQYTIMYSNHNTTTPDFADFDPNNYPTLAERYGTSE